MLTILTEQLHAGQPLADAQVAVAIRQLTDEQIAVEAKADFLTALARKGETVGEIAAFVRELRDRAVPPPLDEETRRGDIMDVCGTGGDRLGTFNVSTTVALVVAAAGVVVAKHGNRAITSRAGSADVLEALGVPIELTPEAAARSLREHQFAFFFAPKYHPAFKHIGPARKRCADQGQRTIFNFLGPLLNPARPTVQLIGVPNPALCEPMARVLQSLGVRRGMVVSGGVAPPTNGARAAEGAAAEKTPSPLIPLAPPSMDELSTLGPSTVAEFYQEHGFAASVLSPGPFPCQSTTLEALRGGDRDTNAEIVRRILVGEERGPKRDVVLLNASAALLVAGQVRSLLDGWAWAGQIIDSGKARAKLAELIQAGRAN